MQGIQLSSTQGPSWRLPSLQAFCQQPGILSRHHGHHHCAAVAQKRTDTALALIPASSVTRWCCFSPGLGKWASWWGSAREVGVVKGGRGRVELVEVGRLHVAPPAAQAVRAQQRHKVPQRQAQPLRAGLQVRNPVLGCAQRMLQRLVRRCVAGSRRVLRLTWQCDRGRCDKHQIQTKANARWSTQ